MGNYDEKVCLGEQGTDIVEIEFLYAPHAYVSPVKILFRGYVEKLKHKLLNFREGKSVRINEKSKEP